MSRAISRRDMCASLAAGAFAAGRAAGQTGARVPDLKSLSLEEKIGQLICGSMTAKDAEEHAAKGWVGSMIGLLANMGSPRAAAEFLNHLQSVSRYPLLFVGEQEHGSHRNIARGTEFPAYMALGATRSKELAYEFGKICTVEGRAVGYNWVSCPTVDVNIEPSNPIINTRSLGERPELVTELGVESCRGIVENRGLTCICHYPGHGATSRDSHVELPVVDRSLAELERVELAPYRAGIRAGVMNCIMTAHNYYPAWEPQPNLPATLSRNIITVLLREKLGYKGLVATDSLSMKAVSATYSTAEMTAKAVAAGCDILLSYKVGETVEGLKRAVESGTLPMAVLDASVARILEAKRWLGLSQKATVDLAAVDSIVGQTRHREIARRVAREAITVLKKDSLPLPKDKRLAVIASAEWGDLGPPHPKANEIFTDGIRKRRPGATAVLVEREGATWNDAIAAARQADAVVVAVSSRIRNYNAESIAENKAIFEQLHKISAVGKPVSLVVTDNPYVVKDCPETAGCILTYSNCPDSVAAAVEVLCGETKAKGRLPVTVSNRYGYGFGL